MKEEQSENTNICNKNSNGKFFGKIKNVFKKKNNEDVRYVIEELIDEACDDDNINFSEHEHLLLKNILDFKNKKCSDVMIPRADIVACSYNRDLKYIASKIIQSGHSRVPIYKGDLDEIIGIAHAKDVMANIIEDNDVTMEDIANKNVLFVSPSMRILNLLQEMQIRRTQMVMVVDEYGGVDGIITIEDLIEEIVGDIADEYDIETPPQIIVNEDSIEADARAEIKDIEEIIGYDLFEQIEDEEYNIDTLGGFVFHLLKRVPAKGEIVSYKGDIKFRILEADQRRILRVMILNIDIKK